MTNFTWIYILVIAFTISSPSLLAQAIDDSDRDSLNRLFAGLENNDKLMGQIALYNDGEMMYSYQLGFSNLELEQKTQASTKYRIGSISKTITSVLILQAIEENKLRLDQTLDLFFPTIDNAESITISQLLKHRSGIHNFTSDQHPPQWYNSPKSRAEMIKVISAGGSDFEPGTKAEYSNSNYVLLSFILEEICKDQFSSILDQKIILPLNLKDTHFGDNASDQDKRAQSYVLGTDWDRQMPTDESITMGAGGVVMTEADLGRFIKALFEGELISTESLAMMLRQQDGYGMGIFKTTVAGEEAYTHDGVIDGFNSIFYYLPQSKTTYILMSNAEDYNIPEINKLVLDVAFDQPYVLPQIRTYETSAQELSSYVGEYSGDHSPYEIRIFQQGNELLAQPKGQRVFRMDAINRNVFKHHKSGVTLRFSVSEKTMLMIQGENEFLFTKG